MIHARTLGLVVAAAVLALPLDAQRGRRGDRAETPPKTEAGTWRQETFESKAVDKTATYSIFVPKGYDAEDAAERKYPLVVWLHGMFEDDRRFVNRGGGETVDRLMAAGEIPEMLVVCPSDGTRRSFYVNSEQGNYEDLITTDLMAHLEANYRIAPDRKQRAIMGISMGGMGALKIAFKNPELFGTVSTHSAAVLPADPADLPAQFKAYATRLGLDQVFGDPIDKAIWAKENPLNLALACNRDAVAGLRIRFDAGTRDRYGFHAGNEGLHKVLDAKKVPHTWQLIDGGGHAWGSGFELESLEASLRFVAEGFTASDKADAGRQGLEGLMPGGVKDAGKGAGSDAGKAPTKTGAGGR